MLSSIPRTQGRIVTCSRLGSFQDRDERPSELSFHEDSCSKSLMSQTIILSRVIGLFLLIVAPIIIVQRHDFATVISAFAKDRLMRVMISAIELIAALFLVLLHNVWSSPPAVIISLFGWLMLIEAVVYLAAPNSVLEGPFAAFDTPVFFVIGGVIALLLGLYLTGYGFGIL